MHNSEWSLVIFTLMSQLSAGVIVCVFIFSNFSRANHDKWPLFLKRTTLIATSFMFIAALFSFFHLASPLASVYALSNLQSSWLSREILMVGVFTATLVITTFYTIKTRGEGKWIRMMLLVSSIAGLLLVFSIGKVYMISTVPPWNTPATLLSFYVTTFLLGASLVMALFYQVFCAKSKKNRNPLTASFPVLKIFTGIILLAVIAQLINTLFVSPADLGANIAFLPANMGNTPAFTTWIFWPLAMGLLIRNLYFSTPAYRLETGLFYLVFVLLFVGEFSSRMLFYDAYFRVGV